MSTVLKRFGARLHNLRSEKGLSQHALAAKAHLHISYISALENGRKTPSLITIERLANGLNVDLNLLVSFGSEDENRDRHQEMLHMIQAELQGKDLETLRRVHGMLKVMLA